MPSSLEILRGWETGQLAAILNKISGGDREKIEALLRDELEIQLVERILKLADKNGRIIPRRITSAVCDADKDFYLIQPQFTTVADYAVRLARFQEAFKLGPVMSAAEFEGRSNKLIAEIETDKSLRNLLNGVYLPVILPQLSSDFTDYGRTLEEVFLPAVKSSYENEFPRRKFYNYREGDLAGKVSVAPESRHDRLMAKMKEGPIVVLYFPAPLQGFSPLASREQIAILPGSLILSGGFDTLSAAAMYPDVFARDWHTPGYDLPALIWQSPDGALFLGAGDDRLYFDHRGSLGYAGDGCSSGLVCLGSA